MRLRTFAALSALPLVARAAEDPTYFQPNSTGVKLQNGFERVFVQPFGEHGFRVRTSLMRDPTDTETSVLLDPPLEGPGGNAGLGVSQTIAYQGSATLRNGNLVAEFDAGVLAFYRVESDGARTRLTAEYTDDKALPKRYYVQEFRARSFEAQFSFTSDPSEMFFGAGQQACCVDHTVNKKGQVIDLVNFNSQVPIPVFMSDKGYLMLFNYPGQGRMEFSPYKTRFVAEEAAVMDYYITTAPVGDYDALQKQYTAATGRQPTPPDFLLGYQQSKLRYWNQTQVIDIAQRFHDEQVNVSLIVVDFFAWKFQGDWSFDPSFFPDPAAMATQVKALTGAEMMVSLWPSVEDLSVNYLPLQQNGLLATTRDGTGVSDSFAGVYTRLIDSTNPDARQFLWQRLNQSYFSKGIHNFWIDQADGGSLGEPFENNGQSITGIPYERAFSQYYLGTQTGVGKIYPWAHQQAIDEGHRNLTSTPADARSCPYMSLSRSTFAGGQRFCSYLWSGDTQARSDTMLQQITAAVSVAASGISSWTLDIGGFSGLDVDSASGRELFVRWFGMGTFLPYMRVHGDRQCNIPAGTNVFSGNNCPNEPWAFGAANFPILKNYISTRYQLVPYVKKLFEDLQSNGGPIMRPLYFDFSLSDPFVVNATRANDPLVVHQYLFGPRMLVSPVADMGVTTHTVYLPRLTDAQIGQGFNWTHWWTDGDFGQGGHSVDVSAPLDQIPVFYLGDKGEILSGNV
ncbi:glycoside hydrolase family 31 protein [Amylostereum chailletii]|nr:glycoside hydrolase family 31 protein [Amylostereum chailletii]